MHQCSRCGRRYPTKLEIREVRRPDGTMEIICKHCQSTSRCDVCGYTSKERKDFGIRKVAGRWRVLCQKCIEKGET